MSTTSSTTTGDDLISEPVLNVHSRLPSAMLTAWTQAAEIADVDRVVSPTAGDDSPIRLPVVYFQRSLPEARSSATRSPLPPPT